MNSEREYIYYKNLLEMLNIRGYLISKSIDYSDSHSKFNKEIYKKLISSFHTFHVKHRIKNEYLIIVIDISRSDNKNTNLDALKKEYTRYIRSNKLNTGTKILFLKNISSKNKKEAKGKDKNVEIMGKYEFIINPLRHESVPEHQIVPRDTFEEKEKPNLQTIKYNDRIVRWLGAKIGDIIKIKRPSISAMYSISYKLVVGPYYVPNFTKYMREYQDPNIALSEPTTDLEESEFDTEIEEETEDEEQEESEEEIEDIVEDEDL